MKISKVSSNFFASLTSSIPYNFKIYCASNNLERNQGEYCIRDNSKYYFCDFVIPELKICVEFYGDYWHCNPAKYTEDYYHPQKQKFARQIWEEDKERLDAIKRLRNFNTYIVWESEKDIKLDFIIKEIQNAVANQNKIKEECGSSASI